MDREFLIDALLKYRLIDVEETAADRVLDFVSDVLVENEVNCGDAEDIGRFSPTTLRHCDTCGEKTRHKYWRNRRAWICFICGSTWFTKRRRAELDAVELTTKAIWDK